MVDYGVIAIFAVFCCFKKYQAKKKKMKRDKLIAIFSGYFCWLCSANWGYG